MTNNWWEDQFEKLERGQSRSQKTTSNQQQQSLPSVQKKLAELTNFGIASGTHGERGAKPQNFTPIDLNKIGETYRTQDNPELNKVREKLHFFQIQQGETRKAIDERKRLEWERKQKMEAEEEEKKKQKQSQFQPLDAPKGKERKSIFLRKKKKATVHEIKPGGGKQ